MSSMASFCAVLFSPREVLDEIWDLIESVSEGFSYLLFHSSELTSGTEVTYFVARVFLKTLHYSNNKCQSRFKIFNKNTDIRVGKKAPRNC